MTRDEAYALFEEVIQTFTDNASPINVKLVYMLDYVYTQKRSATWCVIIADWNGVTQWHFANPQDWHSHLSSGHFRSFFATPGQLTPPP